MFHYSPAISPKMNFYLDNKILLKRQQSLSINSKFKHTTESRDIFRYLLSQILFYAVLLYKYK
jgi:hypothetical protein